MREFELKIDEAINNGLSPFDISPMNSQMMDECLGFRCGLGTIEKYEEFENPLPAALDMHYSWPFPQMVTGERYKFLIIRDGGAAEDHVYLISEDNATATFIFTVDALTFGQGTLMELADFGEYAIMTNGVIFIYWDPDLVAWVPVAALANVPMLRTICNFKGQAVGGGVLSAWHDCDETSYAWSKIGEIDFTPDRQNEAGYRRCPYGGTVLHTRRLGDAVIGYSTKGITALMPVSAPAATFAFKELNDVGIINQGAMNGNFRRQIFLGSDYRLREVTSEGVKIIGFKPHMEDLQGEDVIISFDKNKGDFYIGNSSKTFLLSPKGMTEVPQHPSTLWNTGNYLYGLPDAVDDYEALLVTSPFDMGYRGQKTVFSMETDALLIDQPYVAIDYFLNIGSFGTTAYKPINNQGIAAIIASSNSFRFRLKFTPTYDSSRISYIKARYKMTDLRGIRGVYAPPPRGQ